MGGSDENSMPGEMTSITQLRMIRELVSRMPAATGGSTLKVVAWWLDRPDLHESLPAANLIAYMRNCLGESPGR